MTEQADQLHHDNAPAHSTALGQAFLEEYHITQVCQPLLQLKVGSLRLLAFPKIKTPLKGRRYVNATVTQYTCSVNGVSLPSD